MPGCGRRAARDPPAVSRIHPVRPVRQCAAGWPSSRAGEVASAQGRRSAACQCAGLKRSGATLLVLRRSTMLVGMNLRQIDAFKAVMETGPVTQAAACLHIAQSSATKLLQMCERSAGMLLFTRDRGRLIPAAEARLLPRGSTPTAAPVCRRVLGCSGPSSGAGAVSSHASRGASGSPRRPAGPRLGASASSSTRRSKPAGATD
jgi:hypothetical protein